MTYFGMLVKWLCGWFGQDFESSAGYCRGRVKRRRRSVIVKGARSEQGPTAAARLESVVLWSVASVEQGDDVQNHMRSAIEQNDVSADQDVVAVGRRRWQMADKFLGAGTNFPHQARRKRAAHSELARQSRWQLVALGEPGRKMIVMVAVPGMHPIPILIAVMVLASFFPFFLLPFSAFLPISSFVSFFAPSPLSLGERDEARKRNHHRHRRANPFPGFHTTPPGTKISLRES
jgi:hypothetical protein